MNHRSRKVGLTSVHSAALKCEALKCEARFTHRTERQHDTAYSPDLSVCYSIRNMSLNDNISRHMYIAGLWPSMHRISNKHSIKLSYRPLVTIARLSACLLETGGGLRLLLRVATHRHYHLSTVSSLEQPAQP